MKGEKGEIYISAASCAGHVDWTMNKSKDKFQEELRKILKKITE